MKRKKLIALLLLVTIGGGGVFAGDPSEEKVSKSPLKIYSGGVGAGAVLSLNRELRRESNSFLRLSMNNNFTFRENVSLFLDVNFLFPRPLFKGNMGGDIGFDFYLLSKDFKPFIGVGTGAEYMYHSSGEFGDNFGPLFTAHAGFAFDLNEYLTVRLRVPYHLIMNEYRDQTVSFECSFIFSSRFKNIKRLNY